MLVSKAGVRMRDRTAYYAPVSLGKSRKVTPEGFLLCEGVAIARIGSQVYTGSELDFLKPNNVDQIIVERLPEEVFRPETMASFEGKPVTVQHPNDFVTPENWQQLAVGVTQNVRRGEGIEDDLLLADLLITSADAVAYVNRELPELSAGYNADYEQIEVGKAIQRNIIGNHVALVERGRAGPRVAIKDHEDTPMSQTYWNKFKARLKELGVRSQDAEALQEEMESEDEEEEGSKKLLDALKAIDERIGALENKDRARDEAAAAAAAAQKQKDEEAAAAAKKAAEEKAANKTGDDDDPDAAEEEAVGDTILEAESLGKVLNLGKVYTGDSATKLDGYTEVISRAEILSPGISIPTKDALKGNKGAALATFMRAVLERAFTADGGKELADTFLMGRKTKDLKGHALVGVFNGAAQLARIRNNHRAVSATKARTSDWGKPTTVSAINKANAEFWKSQNR